MQLVKLEDGKTHITLDANDIESALRHFICTCHPEYATGYVVNPLPDSIQPRDSIFVAEPPK